MTIKQAVVNVCDRIPPGQTILGYEMYERVLEELRRSGDSRRPLQTTVSARYREVMDICRMESVQGVSEYRKKGLVELSDEEKRLGQQAMF